MTNSDAGLGYRPSVAGAANIRRLREHHSHVIVIVSPPRGSSTALARVFWEHPAIGYYAHEPFEGTYYLDQTLDDVWRQIRRPLNLRTLRRGVVLAPEQGLVIKEMPYQVGNYFPLLARLATAPLIFLIRDPRHNIASRMRKKREVGHSPFFPLIESGWTLLAAQIAYCQRERIPFAVLDATDFRNTPDRTLAALFRRLNLAYSPRYLTWQPRPEAAIDNLDGAHRHLYEKVLRSQGVLPDRRPPPPLASFPQEKGFRNHVAECLAIYRKLRQLKQLVPGGRTVVGHPPGPDKPA